MNRGDCDPDRQLGGDVVPVDADRRPRHLPQTLPTSAGDHDWALARQSASVITGSPPGTSPAAATGAKYLRTACGPSPSCRQSGPGNDPRTSARKFRPDRSSESSSSPLGSDLTSSGKQAPESVGGPHPGGHARRPQGELRDRRGGLRDREPLKPGESRGSLPCTTPTSIRPVASPCASPRR
jgi:hypothetical protein